MTEQEILKRGEMARELLKYEPYQELVVSEMEQFINTNSEQIINDLVNGRTERAMLTALTIDGIRRVLNIPLDAVKEANNLNEHSGPS